MVQPRQLGTILMIVLTIGWGADSAHARFLTAQQAAKTPRARIACLPSPTMGVRYTDLEALGQHGYRSGSKEGNGILYTCRGGHIDITHTRKLADWTGYLAYHLREALVQGHEQFSFKMLEPTRHHIALRYPAGWRHMNAVAKREIATQVSICLAEHLAYTGSVWHEILTWHGFKAIGFYPEYNSAFSWEDNYSNALGCRVGGLALRDGKRDFDDAVTLYTRKEIERLGARSKEAAKEAGAAVRGWWYVGAFIRVEMVKRHLDVGLGDGYITPWLVPEVAGCEAAIPELYPVPDLELLEIYGFGMKYEIEPREWERHKILRALYPNAVTRPDRFEPARHLGTLIEHVRAKAIRRYGPHADVREGNVPERFRGSAEFANASSESDASGDETEQDSGEDEDKKQRNLLEFLGSIVSRLVRVPL